jgi:Flp pilus assembly protein CpaB
LAYLTPPSAGTEGRQAQIHAGTVFALTLALLAGLIGAYLFKVYVLNGKTPPPETKAPPTFPLTVAAVNIMDRMQITQGQVKTVNVSKEEYDRVASNPRYLRGNQPVGRTTLKSIKAEDPIFEDSLEPLEYPRPVSLSLHPGKRAVIVEVPSKAAMVQVGDRVDVLCTLANDAFGPGQNATAVIARDLRVVARFNTTRTAAQPDKPDTTRTYTLEASPYRHALMELAKSVGATFTLSVTARSADDSGVAREASTDEDPETDRVTSADLAKLFGIKPPPPVAERPRWEIERWSGTERMGSIIYELVLPDQPAAPPKGTGPAPKAGSSLPKTGSQAPRSQAPAAPAAPRAQAPQFHLTGTMLATTAPPPAAPAADNTFGFRAPVDKSPAACKT